ncbi:unnamed protein product [Larinioides sclopetarius]|uniref:Uncharacterized protein n=1 Tax=Larinioides sclopetarius TaxID=280406 RepID=A0AAV2AUR6_9ARAC
MCESKDDSKSEDDDTEPEEDDDTEPEDQESNLHTDRSVTSEGDKCLSFSADQSKLEDSYSGLSSQYHDDDDDILREMKLNHEKEILSYKQNIDELQSKLISKIEEAKDLNLKNSELQKKYEQLEVKKNEWINKMSEEFAAQKKCQLFLESGAIEEIKHLRLQVKSLEGENSLLKTEVKDLTSKNSELQKKHEQLQVEKNEWLNKMSEEFATLKKCQLFLESGAVEEINHLRLQVKRLEREGSLLKESFLHRRIRYLLSWLPFSNLLLN